MLIKTTLGLGALALLTATLASCTEPSVCTLASCNDALQAQGEVPFAIEERVHLQIETCRNGLCSSAEVDTDDANPGAGFIGFALSGDANIHGMLRQRAPNWELTLSFTEDDAGSFEDGDLVHVRVVDLETNETLEDLEQTVTYGTFAPNGVECGPVCKSGQVTLSML